ncbi:MAG: hypothetical protein ACLUOI_24410 [Eisenbergiella sp.]
MENIALYCRLAARAAEELLGNIVLACFAAVLLPLSGKFVKNG